MNEKRSLFGGAAALTGVLALVGPALAQRVDDTEITISLRLDGSRIQVQVGEDGEVQVLRDGKLIETEQIDVNDDRIVIKDLDSNPVFRVTTRDDRVQVVKLPRSDRAAIGIEMAPLSKGLADHLEIDPRTVVYVTGVSEGRAAAKAGMRDHDVIVQIEGRSPSGEKILQEVLSEKKPGDPMVVKVLRRGQELELVIRCDRAPATDFFRFTDGSPFLELTTEFNLGDRGVVFGESPFFKGITLTDREDRSSQLKTAMEAFQKALETETQDKTRALIEMVLKNLDEVLEQKDWAEQFLDPQGTIIRTGGRKQAVDDALEQVKELEGSLGDAEGNYQKALDAARSALRNLKEGGGNVVYSIPDPKSGDGTYKVFGDPVERGALDLFYNTGRAVGSDDIKQKLDSLEERFDRLEKLLQQLTKKSDKSDKSDK